MIIISPITSPHFISLFRLHHHRFASIITISPLRSLFCFHHHHFASTITTIIILHHFTSFHLHHHHFAFIIIIPPPSSLFCFHYHHFASSPSSSLFILSPSSSFCLHHHHSSSPPWKMASCYILYFLFFYSILSLGQVFILWIKKTKRYSTAGLVNIFYFYS